MATMMKTTKKIGKRICRFFCTILYASNPCSFNSWPRIILSELVQIPISSICFSIYFERQVCAKHSHPHTILPCQRNTHSDLSILNVFAIFNAKLSSTTSRFHISNSSSATCTLMIFGQLIK